MPNRLGIRDCRSLRTKFWITKLLLRLGLCFFVAPAGALFFWVVVASALAVVCLVARRGGCSPLRPLWREEDEEEDPASRRCDGEKKGQRLRTTPAPLDLAQTISKATILLLDVCSSSVLDYTVVQQQQVGHHATITGYKKVSYTSSPVTHSSK